jgi:hypothetical protein
MNVLTKIFSDTILEGKVLLTAATSRIYLLMMATVVMYRSTAHKVLPAMYIENVTQLAFDDVSAEDQDFAFIQGLAEAGLIWSNLSTNDVKKIGKDSRVCFEPDRPLSRQDLVSWKLALDRHELAGVDKEALQKVSGFVDVDQIHKDAWPALMADLTAEGPSIIASAFGMIHFMCPCSHANMPGENRAVQFVQKSLQTGLFIFRVYTPEIAILWTDN